LKLSKKKKDEKKDEIKKIEEPSKDTWGDIKKP